MKRTGEKQNGQASGDAYDHRAVDVDEVGKNLYRLIDQPADGVTTPLVVTALQWANRQEDLKGRQRRVLSALIMGTLGWRKAVARISRDQLVEWAGLAPGAASNRAVEAATAELLRRGIIHRMRGRGRGNSSGWWLDWVEQMAARADRDEELAASLLGEVRAAAACAEVVYARSRQQSAAHGGQESAAHGGR